MSRLAEGGALAPSVTLGELVQALGGELQGAADLTVRRIASLEQADEFSIGFLAQARLQHLLAQTRAACVIVKPAMREQAVARGCALIVTADPYLYYARLTRWWRARFRPAVACGIHPSAVVGEGVQIHPSATIGALAVIEDGATIGAGVVIGAHTLVGRYAEIGAGSRLAARVVFGEACVMGERGMVHSGAVVGADGFGFAPNEGQWEKIEQLGAVRIGNDVDIGANTCVDRGALDDTILEDGVKLDNLIQIAHNVRIGAHTAMAGCVGVAGSARIGSHCTFGGAAMVNGHIDIADNVHVMAGSLVMSSIAKAGTYCGFFPIDEAGNWEKNAASLRRLHTFRTRLRELEKKITP